MCRIKTSRVERRKEQKFGYQLLELLVVMAIVGLLGAILLPVFSRVREGVRRTSCQSNLKQIGLAVAQYGQDWDDTIFPYQTSNDSGSTRQSWQDLLYPYTTTEGTFNCPSNLNGASYKYSQDRSKSGGSNFGSYNISGCYTHRTTPPFAVVSGPSDAFAKVKLAQIVRPAETILAGDGYPGRNIFNLEDSSNKGAATVREDSHLSTSPRLLGRADIDTVGLVERHLGTANVLWADGHVKASRIDRLMLAATSKGYPNSSRFLKYFTIEDD